MEIRVLQYFLAIAREQSISKASEYLHISQPTLSRQIKELEDELGTILFERGSRHITLTEDGLLLRQRAEEIISLVNKTEADIVSGSTTLKGDVYIGCAETEAMSLVAKSIHQVQIDQPDIKFHLHSGNAEDIIDRLEKGLIDFGVLVDFSDLSKYHYIQFPAKDSLGVLMPKNCPLANRDTITASDLIHQPLILSKQDFSNNHLPKYLLEDKQYRIVATYNLIYNASLMVREGVGYAIGLDKLINTDCMSDLCFKPIEPQIESEIVLVWKKYQQFSKSAQYFLNTIQALFKKCKKQETI